MHLASISRPVILSLAKIFGWWSVQFPEAQELHTISSIKLISSDGIVYYLLNIIMTYPREIFPKLLPFGESVTLASNGAKVRI